MGNPQTNMQPQGNRGTLFQGYESVPGVYDELLDESGQMRPHWRALAAALEALGPEELNQREAQGRRLLQEMGSPYEDRPDTQVVTRAWDMDILPQIISSSDWARLEAGLSQRVELLNLLLADLYGEQRCIYEGVAPPELLFANPLFQRPLHHMDVPSHGLAPFIAIDVARTRDGSWVVVGDGIQTPSGAGFALENRIVQSRMFPNIISRTRVQRLAPFFDTVRGALRGMVPYHRDNPTVALLTSGPYDASYFEHAYLARYLNFVLVEGADLTVRDNQVYLKTLEGLKPVDVILRHLEDAFCDPLELHSGSSLGLVGLLQAAQSGHVTIVNNVGGGVVENPALAACLPALCRYYLDADLIVPGPATWWCAKPADLHYVEQHLDSLHLRPAFGMESRMYGPTRDMEPGKRALLIESIRRQPHAYVAQEMPEPATAPIWTEQGISRGSLALRTYAMRDSAGQCNLLPGGLSRIISDTGLLGSFLFMGEGSKDTWVLSETPVAPYSLLPRPDQPLELRRASNVLPSRVADNFYWLGRYCERIEHSVRILRYMLTRLTEESSLMDAPELPNLSRTLETFWPASAPVLHDGDGPDFGKLQQALFTAVFDEKLNDSVTATMRAMQRSAWVVRDRFSVDNWRVFNQLMRGFMRVQRNAGSLDLTEALDALDFVISGMAAFSGLSMENMTRGPGWRFLDLGRRLERALATGQLLSCILVEPLEPEEPALQALLRICDGYMTYRSRYGPNYQTAAVIDLLLFDETNPRSAAFQVQSLSQYLDMLPHSGAYEPRGEEERLIIRLLSGLRLAEPFKLAPVASLARRNDLEALLEQLIEDLPRLSDAVAHRYFSHTLPARQIEAAAQEAGP